MVAVWSFALLLAVSRVRWFRLPFTLLRVGVGPLCLALVACGGFVLFFLCLAPRVGVGFGPLRPARRWFRLSLILVRVWCWSSAWRWFWPFASNLVFWSRSVVSFSPFFVWRLVLVDPRNKVTEDQT